MTKKFVSWRRVSTQRQGISGLGLEAQKDIIDYFVRAEKGELIGDFCEVYTGTELSGCVELSKAIDFCKSNDATLIIAKTDRFRNTREALEIYDQMGEGNIYFCDLPSQEKFVLTLFFALAEREAKLISIRTKAALRAKVARGEPTGGCKDLWGKYKGTDRKEAIKKAVSAAVKIGKERAMLNPENRFFRDFIEDWEAAHGKIGWQADWKSISEKLNSRGRKTATGLEYTPMRARAMYDKIQKLY